MEDKMYIGDGVWVQYNGFHVVLTTNDYRIFLEPAVFSLLIDYARRIGIIKE